MSRLGWCPQNPGRAIFTYATFAAILLYVAAAASVFTLRCTRPDLPRPYKVWGYPAVPAFFLTSVVAIAITGLIERPLESFSGLGVLALGIPAYYFWKHQGRRGGSEA